MSWSFISVNAVLLHIMGIERFSSASAFLLILQLTSRWAWVRVLLVCVWVCAVCLCVWGGVSCCVCGALFLCEGGRGRCVWVCVGCVWTVE